MSSRTPSFADQVVQARLDASLTQQQVADMTGAAIRTVKYWESGEVEPRKFTQQSVLAALKRRRKRSA